MQNKKDKRIKSDVRKTMASGSADAKNGATDAGKKGAKGTTGGKKGWKK